jgi:hypothetical protein
LESALWSHLVQRAGGFAQDFASPLDLDFAQQSVRRHATESTGLGHIPGDIEGETYICGGDGMVLLLVPYLDGPFRNYFVEQAALHGFRRTGIPDLILFGEDPRNTVAVMVAQFKKGNVLVIGHWGVPLFQR